jgi:hypothetical protein
VKEKKKKKSRKWFLLGIGLVALISLAILFTGMDGRRHLDNLSMPKQAEGVMRDTVQKGRDIAGNFNMKSFHERGDAGRAVMQHGPKFEGHGEEMMGHRHGFHDHHGPEAGKYLVGLAALFALLLGWYLRRVKGKKLLGNLLILVGILPILPFVLIGILIYWLVKKVRSGKQNIVSEPLSHFSDRSLNAQLLDEWERKTKMEEK